MTTQILIWCILSLISVLLLGIEYQSRLAQKLKPTGRKGFMIHLTCAFIPLLSCITIAHYIKNIREITKFI